MDGDAAGLELHLLMPRPSQNHKSLTPSCSFRDYRDTIQIAVNVVRYALLQDISYSEKIK